MCDVLILAVLQHRPEGSPGRLLVQLIEAKQHRRVHPVDRLGARGAAALQQ